MFFPFLLVSPDQVVNESETQLVSNVCLQLKLVLGHQSETEILPSHGDETINTL
jgi:hypothetical protein